MTSALCGVLLAVLRLTGGWSWWSALWIPLIGFALVSGLHDWVLTIRSRWQMGAVEWVLLTVSHCSFLASAAFVTRLLR
ncbi:hypothetical protein [Kitasatospora purpeofusca]|uniref:hypothetical protein n=1 Tax=Kitasatospora purpeofusca TaxID=67352 RepID=UPI00364EF2F5